MNKNTTFAFRLLTLALVLTAFSFTVAAQKKTTTKPTAKKPAATASNANAAEIKSGAEKVSIQLKNVSKFIYILGGVAKGIEDIDKEARTGKVSRNVLDQNAQFKQSVIRSIQNLRAGLVALEIEFRTKNGLKPYMIQIQGVSDLAGTAEDQAANGMFTESGKTLLVAIEKLADTLAALP